MTNYPLVSLCVPIYGVEKYIARCAKSLLEQTYENIEYVFINDCTKDKSMEILNSVIKQYPQREASIKIINHEYNLGLAGARNTAIEASKGEFIMWVDSDDYIDVNTVKLAVNRQIETDADIVNFNIIWDFGSHVSYTKALTYQDTKAYTLDTLSRKASVNLAGRLIRRQLYIVNNIRAEKGVNMGEDYQVIPRLMYYAQKSAALDLNLYHYDCTNNSSISHILTKENNRQLWRAYDILYNFFSDKGEDYVAALKTGCTALISMNLVVSYKSKQDRQFFLNKAQEKLSTIETKYWKTQPLSKRIMFYLVNKPIILYLYIKLARSLRHFVLKIKHLLSK